MDKYGLYLVSLVNAFFWYDIKMIFGYIVMASFPPFFSIFVVGIYFVQTSNPLSYDWIVLVLGKILKYNIQLTFKTFSLHRCQIK